MKINLTDKEFYILSLYLKRLTWSDYESCAIDKTEAYAMKDLLCKLERILNKNGFNPR